MDRCVRHPFELAEDGCARCGLLFCGECLVYSFGPKKPPFCIPCAVAAAGVRSTAGSRPAVTGRALRQAEAEVRRSSRFFGRKRRDVPDPMGMADDSADNAADDIESLQE